MNYYIGNYYMSDGIKPIMFKLKMPIEWIEIYCAGDEALLISKDCLDWELYGTYEADDGTLWDNSYLKRYLEEKYDEYFTDEEKDAILEKEHGKLFILSETEILKYFPKAEDRIATMSSVYNDEKEVKVSIEYQEYWLRKDENTGKKDGAPRVTLFGDIEYDSPEHDEVGIRPAMWVNVKKVRLLAKKNM